MKIPGLFAVVLGLGATVAAAQPVHEESTGRVSYKNDQPVQHVAPKQGWVELASPTPARYGTEYIAVGQDQGKFAGVRIDASDGRVEVERVAIYFVDGTSKVVHPDRVLDAHRQTTTTIDVSPPREIDRIVITTARQTKGTYAIYGTGGTGVMAQK